MIRLLKRARENESGLAMVEFAIVAPVMILLLVGLVEFGRFAYFSIIVGNAARAGAQYGAQNLVVANDAAGMENAALADGQNISGLTAVATHLCQCADGTASSCLGSDCPGSHRIAYVQVTATGTFSSLFRYPGLPATFNVSNTVEMRVAQ